MSFAGFRRMTAAAAASAVAALAAPLAASAATSKYPPDPDARGFGAGLAGWTASSSFDGNCLPPLLCPSATNSHQAAGGADGGGFVRSAYQGVAGVMAVGGTTTAVFASPPFVYRGADGEPPRAVAFAIDRRASVDQLLAVSGNSATYSVRLVDLSAGGDTVGLIGPTTLAGANGWRSVSPPSIDPDRLVRGHDYRLLIATAYATGTSAVVGGNADYDNVVLSAVDGDGAGKAGKGRGRDAGAGSLSRDRLSDLVRASAPDTAAVVGKGPSTRLLVRVNCPRKVGRNCRVAAQGLLRKGKPATVRRVVKLRKGKAKLLALRVKPKARHRMAKRKRLLVRQRVRAGRVTAVVYKKRKLIRR